LFHGSSTILQDIREKLPQEKLPHAKISALRSDSRVTDNATQILAGLDFVMTFVKKTSTLSLFSVKETTQKTITEYCKQWKLEVPELLKISYISDINLQYLISLYEEVEDIIANTIAEWVDKSYSAALNGGNKDELFVLEQKTSLEVLFITFRRFIFRYLSAEKIDAAQPLSNFLSVLLLCWPYDKKPNEVLLETFFPPSLQVSQTYSAYSLLRDKFEEQTKKKESEHTPEQPTKRSKSEAPKRRTKEVF